MNLAGDAVNLVLNLGGAVALHLDGILAASETDERVRRIFSNWFGLAQTYKNQGKYSEYHF